MAWRIKIKDNCSFLKETGHTVLKTVHFLGTKSYSQTTFQGHVSLEPTRAQGLGCLSPSHPREGCHACTWTYRHRNRDTEASHAADRPGVQASSRHPGAWLCLLCPLPWSSRSAFGHFSALFCKIWSHRKYDLLVVQLSTSPWFRQVLNIVV